MATTGAPGNIPLFDDSTPVTPIQAPFNGIAKALNDALARTVPTYGQARDFTSFSDGTVQIRHGLGKVPTVIQATWVGSMSVNDFSIRITDRNETNFRIGIHYNGAVWGLKTPPAGSGVDWAVFP